MAMCILKQPALVPCESNDKVLLPCPNFPVFPSLLNLICPCLPRRLVAGALTCTINIDLPLGLLLLFSDCKPRSVSTLKPKIHCAHATEPHAASVAANSLVDSDDEVPIPCFTAPCSCSCGNGDKIVILQPMLSRCALPSFLQACLATAGLSDNKSSELDSDRHMAPRLHHWPWPHLAHSIRLRYQLFLFNHGNSAWTAHGCKHLDSPSFLPVLAQLRTLPTPRHI
jgi:hypothetical protein